VSKLYEAVAQRPSDQLERLLHVVGSRLDHHRARALALARISGALQTELARRAACDGPPAPPDVLSHSILESLGL
jgi:hypothetical protein